MTDAAKALLKAELEKIKEEFARMADRINSLEAALSVTQERAAEARAGVVRQASQPPEKKAPPPKALDTDMEMSLGKFWLNKIGIIIFALGIAFLITYTFKYFGPVIKIAFGFTVGAVLFFWGARLEKKEAFKNYGRVLLGGAWAIVYFTTYAMYHFEACRIIDNQLADLFLLGCVALGIIRYSLRYNSEGLTAIALAVGYLTSTLGDISYFTLLSSALLAVITVALVYRLQWVKIILYGIVFTYCAHYFWTIEHIAFSPLISLGMSFKKVYFLINCGFLTIYWLLFTTAIHCIAPGKDSRTDNRLSAANFVNFLLFFFMVYPKFAIFYPHSKYAFVLGLGVGYCALAGIMEALKNRRLSTSNTIIAVSLLTMAVPLKFAALHTSVIWLVELPFLVLMGFVFNRAVLRYLGAALAFVLLCKFVAVDLYLRDTVSVLAGGFSWNKFLSLLGFLSASGCFTILLRFKETYSMRPGEEACRNFYSALATLYLAILLWLWVIRPWLTLALFLEGGLILLCGYTLRDRYLRGYSLLTTALAGVRYCFLDTYRPLHGWLAWGLIGIELSCAYAAYLAYRKLNKMSALSDSEKPLVNCLFFAATFLAVLTIFRHSVDSWISVALGVSGVVLFAVGFLLKEKIVRVGGFIIFAITLSRVVLIDLSSLPIIYKIISFILLGGLFLGVSFIYTQYTVGRQK